MDTGASAGPPGATQPGTGAGLSGQSRALDAAQRFLIESFAQAVWETDAEGVVVADSPSWRAYTGQTLEEWLGYGWLDAIHPDDRAYAERQWRDAMAARSLVDAEFRLRAPDGGWRWTNVRAAPLLDAEGRIEKWAGMNIDIDDRKRAEAALRESEDRYRNLFETMHQGYLENELIRDAEGRALDYRAIVANSQFERLTGIPVGEALSRTARELVKDLDPAWVETYERVVRTGEPEQFEREEPAFGRWYEVQAYPLGGDRFAILYDDITERRRTDAALRESEERQAFLLKLSDTLRPIDDPETVAEAACRLLVEELRATRAQYTVMIDDTPGAEIAEVRGEYRLSGPTLDRRFAMDAYGTRLVDILRSGRTLLLTDIENDDRITADQRAVLRGAGSPAAITVPHVKGGRLTVTLTVHDGKPRHWTEREVGLTQEVASRTWEAVERARVGAALREREADLARVQRIGEVGGLDIDVLADLSSQRSPEYLRLHGLPQDGRRESHADWVARVLPEDRERAERALLAALAGTGSSYDSEYRIVRPSDGEVRWIHARADIERDGKGRAVRLVGAHTDVTEQKRAQDVLRESKQRQGFLLKFSDALRAAPADAIHDCVIEMVAEELSLDLCYIVTMHPDQDRADVTHQLTRGGFPAIPDVLRLSDYPDAFRQTLDRTLVIDDCASDPALSDLDRRNVAAMRFGALVAAPLRRGVGHPIWGIVAVTERPRRWTPGEIRLVEDVAERTWIAIERAAADIARRDSEARLAAAFESVPVGLAAIDMTGTALIANAQYRRFLPNGVIPSRDPARGARWRAWDDMGRPTEPHRFPGARALAGETVVPGLEMLYTDDDGQELWTNVATAPIRDQAGRVTGAVTAIADITLAKHAAATLRESEERLRQFGEASQDVLWIRDVETLQWTYLTPAFETIYGLSREEVTSGDNYRSWLDLVVPEDRARVSRDIAKVGAGEQVAFEYRIRRPSDGAIRWLRNTDFPIRDAAGRVVLIGGVGSDITDKKHAEDRMKLLVAELQHRVRNILAVVRSVFARSAETAESAEALSDHFKGRLDSLARTQVVVTQSGDRTVDLENLIRDELLSVGIGMGEGDGRQVTIAGPEVPLPAAIAETLSLALHELTTNSIKYGALGSPSAGLTIEWQLNLDHRSNARLVLKWLELGVPAMSLDPVRKGFGTELITEALPYRLDAETRLEFRPGGISCVIDIPLPAAEKDALDAGKVI